MFLHGGTCDVFGVMRERVIPIIIKPDLGVDQAKGSGPGFHGSTQKNLKKLKF